jgi:hypothetical protein
MAFGLMDKSQAIHRFWSGFGLDAYDENTVPDEALNRLMNENVPYITYSVSTDSIDNVVNLYGILWYHSSSWAGISKKAEQIADYLGLGGQVIPLDSGYLWIARGTPFSQRMPEPENDTVRKIYINLQAEFLTR